LNILNGFRKEKEKINHRAHREHRGEEKTIFQNRFFLSQDAYIYKNLCINVKTFLQLFRKGRNQANNPIEIQSKGTEKIH
jgi:hypothetical protein